MGCVSLRNLHLLDAYIWVLLGSLTHACLFSAIKALMESGLLETEWRWLSLHDADWEAEIRVQKVYLECSWINICRREKRGEVGVRPREKKRRCKTQSQGRP